MQNKRNCKSCKYSMFSRCELLQQLFPDNKKTKEKYEYMDNFICEKFKSMYIEYPIQVNAIEQDERKSLLYLKEIGKYCKVRYCKDDKTYLGLFLGELPVGISIVYKEDTKALNASFRSNPAIFVFELNKIIYGCESWWSIIEKEEDLKDITDDDINNVWYVKALKQLSSSEKIKYKPASNRKQKTPKNFVADELNEGDSK